MTNLLRILSLGGGVQSVCVAHMSLRGDLPPLDHVIFADTGGEWPGTYHTVDDLERRFERAGVGFHRVRCERPSRKPHLYETLYQAERTGQWSAPPLYTINADGSHGFTNRQCTGDFKKTPIDRKTRELAGIVPRSRGPKEPVVETWLGISADEKQRMKVGHRWQWIWHPLIEGPKPMRRWDCEAYLRERQIPVPVKSACFFCSYQSKARWRQCKNEHPELWDKAVRLDENIRAKSQRFGLDSEVFLTADRVPLADVDLRSPEELGQSTLFEADGFSDECHGVCGV